MAIACQDMFAPVYPELANVDRKDVEWKRSWKYLDRQIEYSRRLLLLIPDGMSSAWIKRAIGPLPRVSVWVDFLRRFRPELVDLAAEALRPTETLTWAWSQYMRADIGPDGPEGLPRQRSPRRLLIQAAAETDAEGDTAKEESGCGHSDRVTANAEVNPRLGGHKDLESEEGDFGFDDEDTEALLELEILLQKT
ncbi:MAG: hypothetical protein M1826_005156 [Phylliscum demangeonii]|nr:MAG: hypothetical protein M1826_005156 [Phylliscum demangeonii]